MFGIELLMVMVFGAPLGSVSAPTGELMTNTVHARTVTGYVAGIKVVNPTTYGSPANSVKPCVTEDSRNCTWDGRRNNGVGASFVDVKGSLIFLVGLPND